MVADSSLTAPRNEKLGLSSLCIAQRGGSRLSRPRGAADQGRWVRSLTARCTRRPGLPPVLPFARRPRVSGHVSGTNPALANCTDFLFVFAMSAGWSPILASPLRSPAHHPGRPPSPRRGPRSSPPSRLGPAGPGSGHGRGLIAHRATERKARSFVLLHRPARRVAFFAAAGGRRPWSLGSVSNRSLHPTAWAPTCATICSSAAGERHVSWPKDRREQGVVCSPASLHEGGRL